MSIKDEIKELEEAISELKSFSDEKNIDFDIGMGITDWLSGL